MDVIEKLITPSKEEKQKINQILKELLLAFSNRGAELVVGGSIGKGTWLPNQADIDLFMLFDYETYKRKSSQLADLASKLIPLKFKTQRLHGSRDYFQFKYRGYQIEVVPVIKIEHPAQALNLTDNSPLHVDWVQKNLAKQPKLALEIRKAKQFMKANRLYGAESYIGGFSGHVTEILVIHFGSFRKLIQAASKWRTEIVIDVNQYYSSDAKAKSAINLAKLQSPLLVVDPIQKDRNAAAALTEKRFAQFISACKQISKKESINLFKLETPTVALLKKQAKNRKLVTLKLNAPRGKTDVVGAKIMKKFHNLEQKFKDNDFNILDSDWYWPGKGPALLWFYFSKKNLSTTKIHFGPPINDRINSNAFTKKWGAKVKSNKTKLYIILKRKYKQPEEIIGV